MPRRPITPPSPTNSRSRQPSPRSRLRTPQPRPPRTDGKRARPCTARPSPKHSEHGRLGTQTPARSNPTLPSPMARQSDRSLHPRQRPTSPDPARQPLPRTPTARISQAPRPRAGHPPLVATQRHEPALLTTDDRELVPPRPRRQRPRELRAPSSRVLASRESLSRLLDETTPASTSRAPTATGSTLRRRARHPPLVAARTSRTHAAENRRPRTRPPAPAPSLPRKAHPRPLAPGRPALDTSSPLPPPPTSTSARERRSALAPTPHSKRAISPKPTARLARQAPNERRHHSAAHLRRRPLRPFSPSSRANAIRRPTSLGQGTQIP